MAAGKATGSSSSPYHLKISRLTIDKLGVKLYDKVSAVVAELIANGYDADAEKVTVRLPLNAALATTVEGSVEDKGLAIEVIDNGHGMTPQEARDFYLRVGTDRRARAGGAESRKKKRPVMGRKGIGKLAPFGICRRIEIRSAGGAKTAKGFKVTHFYMDFEKIVADEDKPVALEVGSDDESWSPKSGTRIRLSNFLAKRVPDRETFLRQLAVRFTLARPDFQILIIDTSGGKDAKPEKVDPLNIPLAKGTRIDLASRPVAAGDGVMLPVSGWLAMARDSYKHEETSGVRIYARGKIVAITRDFNQPAGFTGEFTMRSYLVGEVTAEWLDLDQGDDLVRTDRQDILWDSEMGQYLRRWGAELIKEIAKKSREPRRERARDIFLERSNIEERAQRRFGDKDVVRVAVELAKTIGSFAAEDELEDETYVEGLSQFILSAAPHHALIEAFQEFNNRVTGGSASLDELAAIFDKTQIAELASYAQIAVERVRVIDDLRRLIDDSPDESEFQSLLASAPWLIEPSWSVITMNQSLKTFKQAFEAYWKKKHGEDILLAIGHETKRPDFTLVSIDGFLHIVEIKKAGHSLDDADADRLLAYVDGFEDFFEKNHGIADNFARGWRIDVVADGDAVKDTKTKRALRQAVENNFVKRASWEDFLDRAKKVHEQFLDIHDKEVDRKKKNAPGATMHKLSAIAGGKGN